MGAEIVGWEVGRIERQHRQRAEVSSGSATRSAAAAPSACVAAGPSPHRSKRTRAMSAAAVRIRPARVRVGRAPTAASVFGAAAGLCALHWLDAAFLSSWRGESASTGAPAAIVGVLFAACAVGVWPRLPRGPRALVAFVAGLITAVAGGLAMWQLSAGSAEGGAWTGLLLVPAGAAMLGCAVVTMAPPPRDASRLAGRAARWESSPPRSR